MSDLYKRFKTYIEENEILDSVSDVVIGVSGGADSVCLLLLFEKYSEEKNIRISVVHVNHCLRGEEADGDEEFVKNLCDKLGVPFRSAARDIKAFARECGCSVEEAGRKFRYATFCYYAQGDHFAIAVAHSKDDQAETVIHNLIRGTGLVGLAGMKCKTTIDGKRLIRPLLFAGRSEIEEYLSENGQDYRTDKTNDSTDYTRNKIRKNILPEMKEINTKAAEHIAEAAEKIAELNEIFESETEEALKAVANEKDTGIYVDVRRLKEFGESVMSNVIFNVIKQAAQKNKDIAQIHVEDALSLLDAANGKRISLPEGVTAVKENEFIVFRKQDAQKTELETLRIKKDFQEGQKYEYTFGKNSRIIFEIVGVDEANIEEYTQKNLYTKVFDYDKISDSVFLGKRTQGDTITLNCGSKSLNRYMIDNKIPIDERDSIPILKDDNEVIWIVGYRINEKYKLADKTKTGLRITVAGDIDERS